MEDADLMQIDQRTLRLFWVRHQAEKQHSVFNEEFLANS